MISFHPIASSSAGCCYVVQCKDHAPLLLECGIPYRRISLAVKHNLHVFAGCLISHSHSDHCFAVDDLLTRAVDCYASKWAWESMLGAPHHRAIAIGNMETKQIGNWKVLAFEAVHDSPGTLGFLIDSPEGDRLLYLTDSCYSRFTFPGLTQVAVECNHSTEIVRRRVESGELDVEVAKRVMQTHMSLERLVDLLSANDLKNVDAIHLLHLSGGNSDEALFKRTVQEATGVPVYVAPRGGK